MKQLMQLTLCIFAILTSSVCFSQETVNGSFEMINNEHIPRGWTEVNTGNHYTIKMDSLQKHNGNVSVMIDGRNYPDASADSSAVMYNGYGLMSSHKIRIIELSGWIKMNTNADSTICIVLQSVRGDTTIKAFARPSGKMGGWQQVTLTFTPNSSHNWYGFYYGVETDGSALAWFDDMRIKVDSKVINDPVSATYEPTTANIRWLNENLHPLTSVDAGNSWNDMAAIGKLCNNASVVGIGEPTHGTGEALRFKLKLLQYLVTQKGFTTIALEEGIAVCDEMNDIINHPSSSVKDSLQTLPFYKLWKSEEVAAMLQWLQTYNASHSHQVKFIGIDEEDFLLAVTRRQLIHCASQTDSNIRKKALLADRAFCLLRTADSSHAGDSKINASVNSFAVQLTSLEALLNSEAKENLLKAEAFFTLKTYVRVCRQWLRVKYFSDNRDSCLADNIRFYNRYHPADKIMVWAHDFHISNYSSPMQTMGAYLKHDFGEKYKAIGFTSSQGSYVATEDWSLQKWNRYRFEKAYRGTCEYILAKAKDSLYFLSTKDAINHKQAAWLSMPMKHLDVPYVKADSELDYKYAGIIGQVFDGIVFCKTTSANHSYLLADGETVKGEK